MPISMRFTKSEQELLRKKCIELNKELITKGQLPIRESELAHKLLDISIRYAKIGVSGQMIIDES